MTKKSFKTAIGKFDQERWDSIVRLRHSVLLAIEEFLVSKKYLKVTTSSLVNVAGSCENPFASFELPYYGNRKAHLSQSAQIQLENMVHRGNGTSVYTVNNSFREEDHNDPDPAQAGRRISEFTLIEPERMVKATTPDDALKQLIKEEEEVIKHVLKKVLKENEKEIKILGGDIELLKKSLKSQFKVITYEEAIALLNKRGGKFKYYLKNGKTIKEHTGKEYVYGDDFGIREERVILEEFNFVPTFVTHFPREMKFFNMKQREDGVTYSADLLMWKMGETIGSAVRECDPKIALKHLKESKIGDYLKDRELKPEEVFGEYFSALKDSSIKMTIGYGIGFERLIGNIIQSNDILNTMQHNPIAPGIR